jgi:hypothetical protein
MLEALGGSGLLRMRMPRRYGGYESDMRTVTEVLAELARGDSSTAWTASVRLISSWLVGLFPDAVRDEVFAPAERVLPLGPVIGGVHPSQQDPAAPIWQARSCRSLHERRRDRVRPRDHRPGRVHGSLPNCKITYTEYTEQSAAPLTHLQVAGAAIGVDEAGFHALRTADQIDAKAASGDPWSLEERARARLDLGTVCLRAKEVVDVLAGASGALFAVDQRADPAHRARHQGAKPARDYAPPTPTSSCTDALLAACHPYPIPLISPGGDMSTNQQSALSTPEVTQRVTAIWTDVLGPGSDRPGATFFELNGQSIAAVRIAAAIEEQLGVTLDIGDLFEDPDLEALTRVVLAGSSDSDG